MLYAMLCIGYTIPIRAMKYQRSPYCSYASNRIYSSPSTRTKESYTQNYNYQLHPHSHTQKISSKIFPYFSLKHQLNDLIQTYGHPSPLFSRVTKKLMWHVLESTSVKPRLQKQLFSPHFKCNNMLQNLKEKSRDGSTRIEYLKEIQLTYMTLCALGYL